MRVARHVEQGVVVAVVLLAASLRVWGIGFGFPHVLAHPDEVRVVHTGVGFLSGDLDPGFFNYPTLFMYALGALDAGYCAAGILSGRFQSIATCAGSWPAAWEPFFLLGRGLSAAAGTLSVVLVWRIGRRLFDRATGLASGAFLAVAFLHVRDSHFAVTDVSMTAMLLAAVLLLVRAHDAPSPRPFAVAGLVAGLATATKYSAGFVSVAVVASQAIAWRRDEHGRPDSRLAVFAAAMAAGFFAGTPFAAIAPERVREDLAGEAAHLLAGHALVLDVGWRHHFVVTLWHGLTWPILIAALAGMALMAWRRPARAALLLAFPLTYYVVAGRGLTVFARYMVPVAPFLCVAAAYAAVAAGRRLATAVGLPVALVLTVVVGGLGAWSLVKSVEIDWLLARTDSRVLAAEWIREHVAGRSSIHASGLVAGRPDLAPRAGEAPLVVASFDEHRKMFRAAGADLPEGPDVIVIQESPLVSYSHVPPALRERLAAYELRSTFRAFDDRQQRVYDQQDAFFLPLANFQGMARPGPNISIYVRRR